MALTCPFLVNDGPSMEESCLNSYPPVYSEPFLRNRSAVGGGGVFLKWKDIVVGYFEKFQIGKIDSEC